MGKGEVFQGRGESPLLRVEPSNSEGGDRPLFGGSAQEIQSGRSGPNIT